MNSDILLPFLLEFLAKSALILATAALVNRASLRASAAQRHLVWCAALITVLLLPLTRLHTPRWTVPLQRVTVELPRQPRTDLPPIESVVAATAITKPVPTAPRWRWPDWKQAIIIPHVEFRDASLAEAIVFLRKRAADLESNPNPALRGVNLLAIPPAPGSAEAKITLNLEKTSLGDILRSVASLTNRQLDVESSAMVLRPKNREQSAAGSIRK